MKFIAFFNSEFSNSIHESDKAWINFELDLLESGKTIQNLDASDLQDLISLAETSTYAEDALVAYYDYALQRPIQYPVYEFEYQSMRLNNTIENTPFKLQPNPADDHTTLFVENWENDLNLKVEIRDISGRVVFNALLRHPHTEFETSLWHSGMYFVNILAENRVIWNSKLIKQ